MINLLGIRLKNIDSEEDRKSFVIVLFTILGCFVMTLFGIKGIIEHRIVYSIVMFCIVGSNITNIIVFKKKRNLRTAPHVILFTMGLLFMLLFLFIGKNGTGIYWFFTFPALAILLTDNKRGLIYAFGIVLLSLIFVVHHFGIVPITYEKEQLIRFYAVYFVDTLLIYIFEYARSRSYTAYMDILAKMKDKNDELSAAEEELRLNNEELLTLNESIEKQHATIQENESRLKTIIENQGEGFAIIDNGGSIKFYNREAETILEFSEEITDNQNIADYISPLDFQKIQKGIASLSIGQKVSYELEIMTKKGNKRFILVTLSHNTDDKKRINGQIAIFRDITGRKKEEQKLKRLNQNLKKYFTVIEQSKLTILITDTAGNIEYTNPFFSEITGYTKEEVIGKNTNILKTKQTPKETFDSLWHALNEGVTWSGELINAKKDGSFFIERAVISPVTDENGIITDFVAIKEDITEFKSTQAKLDQQRQELESTYKNLRDSISYAKTIQDALLIKHSQVDQWLPEYFIFSKPKELVGGDFYYINKINKKIIIAVADCTGHGIPGAFMTLLGLTYLHENFKQDENQTAGEILDKLRHNIKDIFKTFGSENNNGMDMALCLIDTETNTMQYSGANNPLYIIRNNELLEFEATKNPIGYYPCEKEFENHLIPLQKDDFIYLVTDGLQDQFGGEQNRTFTRKRLKKLMYGIYPFSAEEQEDRIKSALKKWQGANKQVDDITILGFKWGE